MFVGGWCVCVCADRGVAEWLGSWVVCERARVCGGHTHLLFVNFFTGMNCANYTAAYVTACEVLFSGTGNLSGFVNQSPERTPSVRPTHIKKVSCPDRANQNRPTASRV